MVVIDPWVSTEIERTILPSKVMLRFESALKPEPIRSTVVPGGPVNGDMVNDEITVKFWMNEFPIRT